MTVEGIELEEGDIVKGKNLPYVYRVSGPKDRALGGYPLEGISSSEEWGYLICQNLYDLLATRLKSPDDLKVGEEYMLVGENVPKEYRGKTAVLQKHTVTTTPEVEVKEWYFWGDEWDVELVSLSTFPMDITNEVAIPYTPPPEFKVEEGMFVQLQGEWVHCNCLGEFRRIHKVSDGKVYYREELPERYVEIEQLLSPGCVTRLIEEPEPGMVVRLEGTPGHSWGRPDCAGKRAVIIEPEDEFFRCRILEGPKKGVIQILSRGSICSEHWWKYITLLNQTEEEVLKENEPEVAFEAGDVVRCVNSDHQNPPYLVNDGLYIVEEFDPNRFDGITPWARIAGFNWRLANRFEKVETADEYKGVKVGDEVVLYSGGSWFMHTCNLLPLAKACGGNKLAVFKVRAIHEHPRCASGYFPVLEGPDGEIVTNKDGTLAGCDPMWCVPVRKIKGLKVKSPRSALEVGSKIVLWNERIGKFWEPRLSFETVKSMRIPSGFTEIEVYFESDRWWVDPIDWCTPIDDVIDLELEEDPPKASDLSTMVTDIYDLFYPSYYPVGMDIGGSPPW